MDPFSFSRVPLELIFDSRLLALSHVMRSSPTKSITALSYFARLSPSSSDRLKLDGAIAIWVRKFGVDALDYGLPFGLSIESKIWLGVLGFLPFVAVH